ncbi:MAG: formylglycine-generating enzyme family protein [Kofleriaceae bacterium]|nr:formylglycine-generating enzyme family protein [Myxococcales bacterium]MCB9563714.1 formylglycine-generating enzyme family protein [Kofleriaceae bacterium]MCB9573057.1 formylglycine-generating enzyme family protein [Kofleriaceae bacterium]
MRASWILLLLLGCGCRDGGRHDVPSPAPSDGGQATSPVDDMVDVPAGWFTAGCTGVLAPSDAGDRVLLRDHDPIFVRCIGDNPPSRRWLSAFAIDRLETTRAAYARCASAGQCPAAPAEAAGGDPRLPIEASWEAATSYCRWTGKRLPTEHEWEKAARGTDQRIYPWGDARPTCRRATIQRDRTNDVAPHCAPPRTPVGTREGDASPYGLQDAAGNAPEWVHDFDDRRGVVGSPSVRLLRAEEVDGPVLRLDWETLDAVAYADRAIVDPQGPERPGDGTPTGWEHVMKGLPDDPSIAARSRPTPGVRPVAGIRCARSRPGPTPPHLAPLPEGYTPAFREAEESR